MTLKEAVLKSLDEIKGVANHTTVCDWIMKNSYYDFGVAKTPDSTISAVLGNFIRNGDTRVKRIKQDNGTYLYYLSKIEASIGIEVLSGDKEPMAITAPSSKTKVKAFEERSLHRLLSSYLKNIGTYSKTIFHEQSSIGRDNNQTWTLPDMVGIKFVNLQTKVSQNLMKAINKADAFKLSSYELKKEINNDAELKKAYFQAVSNSSWANYGYLAAFEFSDGLTDEMERLSQSFGIGIIKLTSNPYKSKVLFQAKFKDLVFKTIDKLCKINPDFSLFIEQIEKLLIAEDRYYKATEKELDELCDKYFSNDSEIENYCKEKLIPYEAEKEIEVQ